MLVLYGVMGMFDSSGGAERLSSIRARRKAGDPIPVRRMGLRLVLSCGGSAKHRGVPMRPWPPITHCCASAQEEMGVVFCKYRIYRLLHKARKRFFSARKVEKRGFVSQARQKLSFCKFRAAIF